MWGSNCCHCDKSLCMKSCILFLLQVRLQTQAKPKPGEKLIYAGTIDCFKKTLAKEVRMPAAFTNQIKNIMLNVFPPSCCNLVIFFHPRVSKDSIKAWQPRSSGSHPCLLSVSLDLEWARNSNRKPPMISLRRWWLGFRLWYSSFHCFKLSKSVNMYASCLLKVSSAVCRRDVVWCVHHGHHGSWRANQMPPTGQTEIQGGAFHFANVSPRFLDSCLSSSQRRCVRETWEWDVMK